MDTLGWAMWLEASLLGVWMRTSSFAYPAVNVVHLTGLVLLIGSIMLLDARLVGAGRRFQLNDVSALLTPLASLGLLLLIGSGLLLFAADAGPLLGNPLFPFKLICIALGVANALLFRALWKDRLTEWDENGQIMARLQPALSLAFWITAAVCGRLLAYV